MKLFVLFLIVSFSEFCLAQKYQVFENKPVYIVYTFEGFNDSIPSVCVSINAYMDSKVFGINYWTSFDNINDSAILKSECLIYHHYYRKKVKDLYKKAYRIYSNCFNPTIDSISSKLYPAIVHKVNAIPIYSVDTHKSFKIVVNKKYNTVYVAYRVNASGIIIDDIKDKCISVATPIGSYFDSNDDNRLPNILFADIKSCRHLNKQEIKKFSFICKKIGIFRFAYSDH